MYVIGFKIFSKNLAWAEKNTIILFWFTDRSLLPAFPIHKSSFLKIKPFTACAYEPEHCAAYRNLLIWESIIMSFFCLNCLFWVQCFACSFVCFKNRKLHFFPQLLFIVHVYLNLQVLVFSLGCFWFIDSIFQE